MLWDDRLVEVWAQPGRAGTGVLVGQTGVLTARHVVEGATVAPGEGRVRARVVVPGGTVGEWVGMEVSWDDERWDVAVLAVDLGSPKADRWLVPRSEPVVIVALGSAVSENCEAVGFPQAEVQHAPGQPDSSPGVRQTEQAWGIVMPAGQAKPPVNPDRPLLPGRWIPFEVSNSTPGTQAGWGGMSGAGVLTPDGRLIGLVKAAEAEHQERRLYVVPLADVIKKESGFAAALEELTGREPVAQASTAPVWDKLVEQECLGEDGLPAPIELLDDLSAFGVKPASVEDEPPFLDYVPRDDENELLTALTRAIESGKMLLVVGGSAAGKSRSLAQAAAERLPGHRLVVPRRGSLRDLPSAPLAELGEAVVWLDDMQRDTDESLADTLKRLRHARIAVVGTIRLEELRALQPGGEVRSPIGEALGDDRLVEQIAWRTGWSLEERARVADHVSSPRVLEAVAAGVPLGAYCVSGPRLLAQLENARRDEINPVPYALVRSVLDWFRTGITQPIPLDEARKLTAESFGPTAVDSTMLDQALTWALTPEAPPPFGTPAQTLLAADADHRLKVHDYVLDHDQRERFGRVPDAVWASAVDHATTGSRLAIGLAAFWADKLEFAVQAMQPLASGGNVDATFNLGLVLAGSDSRAAQHWYERAADAGDIRAMNNLGVLLEEREPAEARRCYERAAVSGDVQPMKNLGRLLEQRAPAEASRWFERAAMAGDTEAMHYLPILLQRGSVVEARRWLERATEAANAGDVAAMNTLGIANSLRDPDEAIRWFERAAEAGSAYAMTSLGWMLRDRQPDAAFRWYESAAETSDPRAMNHFGELTQEADPVSARRWFERAAKAGDSDAMNNLGWLLHESEPGEARRWLERAAKELNYDAMNNLGVLIQDEDPAEARRWYEFAAGVGHLYAAKNLGFMLLDSDPDRARLLLKRAADAGHGDAADALESLGKHRG